MKTFLNIVCSLLLVGILFNLATADSQGFLTLILATIMLTIIILINKRKKYGE